MVSVARHVNDARLPAPKRAPSVGGFRRFTQQDVAIGDGWDGIGFQIPQRKKTTAKKSKCDMAKHEIWAAKSSHVLVLSSCFWGLPLEGVAECCRLCFSFSVFSKHPFHPTFYNVFSVALHFLRVLLCFVKHLR